MGEERAREGYLTPDSKPYLSGFNPYVIPYQGEVLELVRLNYDHTKGWPEIMLSGSYGSAKSILMAHLVVTHCLANPKARVCLARKALPDLKDTIFKEIEEHIDEDLTEGKHYWVNRQQASIRFANGSEIISRSWADKKYKKGRSLKLSGLVIEELTENNQDDKEAFDTLKARVKRLPHVKENFVICATNPDAPSHWAYRYFIDTDNPNRFTFYSVTSDNPFLDPSYIEQLKDNLDPKAAERYIYGRWVELYKESIYYAYQKERNYRNDVYEPKVGFPIHISWDFNIGEGKPLSAVLFQFHSGAFHFYEQCVVEGMRTLDSCEEMQARGLLSKDFAYHLHGDASGRHKDTRNKKSDWDLINKWFADNSYRFAERVPMSNPPIRERHNYVNAWCYNTNKQVRLYVYKMETKEKRNMVDEALRLTALKRGGQFLEDDSKDYQHIGTAIGYGLHYVVKEMTGGKSMREIRNPRFG